jgi:hypothetical protein
MANIPEKLANMNKFIGLCLQGCKRYKGKGLIHTWIKQALTYLMQARQALNEGLFNLYNILIGMAKRRIQWANAELTLMKAH